MKKTIAGVQIALLGFLSVGNLPFLVENTYAATISNILFETDFGAGANTYLQDIDSTLTTEHCYEYGSGNTDPGVNVGLPCASYTGSYAQGGLVIRDGEYSVTDHGHWHLSGSPHYSTGASSDHTGDVNGRMLLVNQDAFHTGAIWLAKNLTVIQNVPIEVSFWHQNASKASLTGIIMTNTVVNLYDSSHILLDSFETGNIPRDESWHQMVDYLNPQGHTNVRIEFTSKYLGGYGNDLLVDDMRISQSMQRRSLSTTGPGGGYDPDRKIDTPREGTILKKVWETVNLIKAVNTLNDSNAKDVILEGQCQSLITDIDNLKTKAIYYDTFINNSTKEYTDNYITFGQFSRVLTKYESLLSTIPTQEQSIGTILQSINKNMNQTIERQTATKILIQGLQKRYSNIQPLALLATDNKNSTDTIDTFSDVSTLNPHAPYIQKAYNLCLVHGTNTKDGIPKRGEERRFEPKRNITIAETIKVLVNMSHSWDKIKGLTND